MADDQKHPKPESTPPGQFVSDDLRMETARFLDELRKRLNREKPEAEPKLGPPHAPTENPPHARDWQPGATDDGSGESAA
ncbi:MAG TPA: hypothetical protein VK488_07495 [Gaiellaceae bacterium]|nr:hypothetical protein [Gaiellaceae bacterium]